MTVYASKLINGKGEQGFCGDDNMTRAEACTVLIRLEDLLKNGGGGTTDPDPGPSEPVVPTMKDIVVTTASAANNSTSYSIADNGNPDGYLANGKPINEENIAELIEKAKAIWPNDMTWTERTKSNNNWYANPSSIARTMLSSTGTGASDNNSANYACGGFGAMISDYLFGKTSNQYHRVSNFEDIHPGDIVVMLNANNTNNHTMIVTSIVQTGSRAGCVFCAEGNVGDTVQWPGTNSYDAWNSTDLAAHGSYVILSRWPA